MSGGHASGKSVSLLVLEAPALPSAMVIGEARVAMMAPQGAESAEDRHPGGVQLTLQE